MPDYPHLQPRSRAAWRTWLQKNHARSTGVWLVIAKKGSGIASLTYNDAVEEALCFGWVDSRPGAVDDQRTRLYFSPRKRGSGWAATNKARIERLTAEGRMHESGLDVVRAALGWSCNPRKTKYDETYVSMVKETVCPKNTCTSRIREVH